MTTINKNLTNLKKEGTFCRNAILGNNEAFYNFAKALGASMEVPAFLARFGDQKLNKAYYGCEMPKMFARTPIIATRIGEDGIEREVVVPWEKATAEERETFDMPIKKLFEKVLDIMLRSFIKASLEVKHEKGYSLLIAKVSPKDATIEEKLQLATEIERFRQEYLTH